MGNEVEIRAVGGPPDPQSIADVPEEPFSWPPLDERPEYDPRLAMLTIFVAPALFWTAVVLLAWRWI